MSLYRNTPTATVQGYFKGCCVGILQVLLCRDAPSFTVQYRILQLLLYRDSATITAHCTGILQVLLYRDTKANTPVVIV
jgi:hypothetical protein